jgi:ferrous iron transport protein B
MIIWLVANITIGGLSIAEHMINLLNPFGFLIGLNGVILLAYIIAIPANEIVIPTVLMLTVLSLKMTAVGAGAGVLFDTGSEIATGEILRAGGWGLLTGINLMLFSLLHNPCSTTIYTIYRETKSVKWAAVSTLLPVIMGFVVCFLLTQFWRLIAGG